MTFTRLAYGALALWLLYDGATRGDYLSYVLAALIGLMAWRNVACPLGLCVPAAWKRASVHADEQAFKQEVEFEEY